MTRCPFCGRTKAKPTGKEWNYHELHVKALYCSDCGSIFREYYKDGKNIYVIPKSVSDRDKILYYLRRHETVSEEELATAFNMPIISVKTILFELEKEGRAYNTSQKRDNAMTKF
jgi:hypothetical protein